MSGSLSGLLRAVLPASGLQSVLEQADVGILELEGPPAARPLVVGALAAPPELGGADRPVLVVTATGREVEELTTVLGDLLGRDVVASFPSWETLPHERLSPRADTVGQRLAVLRRLAHPEEHPAGRLRVVVTAVRSLIQPMAPGLGELTPVDLKVGAEQDFESLVERLVELAYARVDMVEKRGEFAVRGGILDLFPPTAEHPVRVEFWGDEVSEIRPFSVADQRSLPGELTELVAPPCRELLLTDDVKARAAELAEAHQNDAQLTELLEKLAQGIPSEGMEALIPALCPGQMQLLTDVVPAGTHVILADPEKIRARAHDLVRTGQEFLEASWMAAAGGGKAPIDLGASAYWEIGDVAASARDRDHPWWTLSQLTAEGDAVVRLELRPVEAYRGEVPRAFADLRAHVATGGTAVLVVPGAGTAQRAAEQLREAEIAAVLAENGLDGEPPASG